MRLTEDQIKAGILHDDIDVRFAALHYFAESYQPNPTVMPVVIQALERFGRTKAFRYSYLIAHLTPTEETIHWVIEELQNQPRRTEDERNYLSHLSRLLCNADPRLLLPHQQDIFAAPGFDRDSRFREEFNRRLELFTWNEKALWSELEAICEEGKTKSYAGELRWHESEDIVEALGREGGRHVDRMMALLAIKVEEFDNNPMTWMEPLVVRLAGELRHQPAIPLIVAKLHEDAEVLSEECQIALARIGGDEVIRAVSQDYPAAEWHFRLYASGVLGRVHTDLAVQTCIDLLPKEKNLDLVNWLAQALVDHFSFEGNAVARKVLLDDPDLATLREALVPACTLMGQEFPELEEWRKEEQENKRRKPFLYGSSPEAAPQKAPATFASMPLLKADKKMGRNDPCPCGSGKKFKKCCLHKESFY